MSDVLVPRPGKRRGTEVVEAFDTTWLVAERRSLRGFDVQHVQGGWMFGVSIMGRFAQQVAVREEAAQ